jgi:conjugal transfer/entry exclusion protein
MRRVAVLTLFLLALSIPARAQIVVVDPGNLAQAVLIADRTLREYELVWAQYQTILRIAQGLGSMDRYRIPTIGITGHDVGRFEYGAPWLQGLNSGDARGTLYGQATHQLERPGSLLNRLPPTARKAIESSYATIELTDSIAEIGGHQVALVRGYNRRLQEATQALEADVLNTAPRSHELTAVLDKVAAGELLARRQDMATNQLLSHALEQLLARSKRMRDTEAATMNMRLLGIRASRTAGDSLVRGAASDLRTWQQP